MKCSVCNGRGFFPISNIAAKVCPQCSGTGEVVQTNEEWFDSLSTEEKANFLKEVTFSCNTCSPNQFEYYKQHKDECPLKMACAESNGHINWLKENHTE